MATPGYRKYSIARFWDDEFKRLPYRQEPFNDPATVDQWKSLGYAGNYCGALADMKGPQPSWNHRFVEYFSALGWQDIGTAYYRMSANTVMPEHVDTYKRYVELFDLQGRESSIRRALIFLENWQPGHYLHVCDHGVVNWRAGDVIEWTHDAPHSAANIGAADRYTLQITGHI